MDFTPNPRPSSALRHVIFLAVVEARLMLRNGEQLLLALVLPVSLLLVGRLFGPRLGIGLSALVPGVLAMAIWSTCFTSLAIVTGFERRYGVLERLSATTLGRGGLLGGKAVAMMLIAAGQLVVLAAVALALGWRPTSFPFGSLVTVPLAMMTFAALALLLAGTLRAEATLGLANLIYLAGLSLGVIVPTAMLPAKLQLWGDLLPTGALGSSMRATGELWWQVMVLALWAIIALGAAKEKFRWDG